MKIRFFCDTCGREVKAETSRCPGCGKFFSAVECPRCALRGPAPLFSSGCPACGYLFAGPGETGVRKSRGKAEKSRTEPFISHRVFRRLTAVLVLLLLIFLFLLLASPFN